MAGKHAAEYRNRTVPIAVCGWGAVALASEDKTRADAEKLIGKNSYRNAKISSGPE